MNRVPALLAGVLAFLAAGWMAREGVDWLRREPGIRSELLSGPWIEQPLGGSDFALTVPWPLEPKPLEFPPEIAQLIQESSMVSHEADGVMVMATHVAYAPGIETDLAGAVKGAFDNMRAVPGTRSIRTSDEEISLLGMRAFEMDASIERERGEPLHLKGIVFGEGSDLHQMLVIFREDQEQGRAVWTRLRDGIHRRG